MFQQKFHAQKGVLVCCSIGGSSGPNCPIGHKKHGKGRCRTCWEHSRAQAVHGHEGEGRSRAAAPLSQQVFDVFAIAYEAVQRCKDTLTQQMSVILRGCVPSAVAQAMLDASKSKAETVIGRPTKQLETERTRRANTEAQLDNQWERVRELALENETINKQLVDSNTKSVEAKQLA